MPRAVALFSGGLDSTLAICALQQQGFEVEALNIRTTFRCCKTPASQIAAELGVRLTVLTVADDYVEVIRRPSFGYGKGINPCVDCRIYMGAMARRFMEEIGACVVVSGEILGQRPMSQKRRDLAIIAGRSGLEGRLLRPLSAKLLPPTIPETEGLIDRERLYAFSGRARAPLVELARQFGVRRIPQPSTGCALTEISFAPRVRDLIRHQPEAARPHFELLTVGRHMRLDPQTKVIVGRNKQENAWLERFFALEKPEQTVLLVPGNFVGPAALVVGCTDRAACQAAGAILVRYTRQADPGNAEVQVRTAGGRREAVCVERSEAVLALRPL